MDLMKPVLGFAKPAWKFFLPLVAVTVILAVIGWHIPAAVVGVLALYVMYFFRDPKRKTPSIPNSICCPADGKVVSVVEVPCEHMQGGRALRVAIFLNIFNVHVQRAPISGEVIGVDSKPGKFGNAMNEKCSEENESTTVWIDSDFGVVGVRQIAGAIARRIVCKAKVGDVLERGARYGLIQFGSRVELFLPLSATVKVQPGQKVVGGLTCLAVLYEDEVRKGLSQERVAKIQMALAS
ncbi:phosphatidylserine decarboxylase family protein [Candidatus Sumerlaeota bacterium]|nr:phosphatidylserine decarboxylase family protein [Candidatus Sumerlaeota bacterium]